LTSPRAQKESLEAEAIAATILALPVQLGLSGKRSEWPRFLWRFERVENCAHILSSGLICSREVAERDHSPQQATSSELTAHGQHARSWTRFYFRPRTPTQYHCEGIQGKEEALSSPFLGAHAPVTVLLAFDSVAVLSLAETRFTSSAMNLSLPPELFSTAHDFKSLPFQDIYHDSYLNAENKGRIIPRRHSEVLFPNCLDLSALRKIICRTPAERQTLLHQVPDGNRLYGAMCVVDDTGPYWSRPERLRLVRVSFDADRQLRVEHSGGLLNQTYDFEISYSDANSGSPHALTTERYSLQRGRSPSNLFAIGIAIDAAEIAVVVKVNDDLVFSGLLSNVMIATIASAKDTRT
jgi:ssDNA thymidine ADP-ribosyltransferase, DarT